MGTVKSPEKAIYFGPFEVTTQVFLTTPHSFALVNLKPLIPGHVLVCPLRPHKRLTDLNPNEVTDLFTTVQRVQRMLARHYFSQSTPSSASASASASALVADGAFNIALQDGPKAGQTVPHVHVHVLPRIRGYTSKDPDGPPSDEIYEDMASEPGNVGGALWDRDHPPQKEEGERRRSVPGGDFPHIEDATRSARSMQEMEAEADMFRGVLRDMMAEEGEDGGAREAGKL